MSSLALHIISQNSIESDNQSQKAFRLLLQSTFGPKKTDLDMIKSMQHLKEKIFICYTKSDKKIKENSTFLEEFKNFDNLTVSSKTNFNIFEVQKKIIEII